MRYGRTLFSKNIDKNIRQELKINIISKFYEVIWNSIIIKLDKPDTKKHKFADKFDRRKSLVRYKGQNYEIMFEIGKKDGVSTLYGIEHIKKTKKIDLNPHNK